MEIRKLNTLRGVAALIIVISHYSNHSNLWHKTLGFGAGQLGVMLFFLLSGFLMSYLYLGKAFNSREVYYYVLARFARVAPLFLLVVLCSYLLQKLQITGILYNIPDKESLFSHITLLSGTSVLWTIPAEVQFYLIFIFLWWFWWKQRTQLYILITFLMVILVFSGFPRFEGSLSGIPYDIALIPSLPYFIMGLVFGQLYNKWKVPDDLSNRLFIVSLFLILLLYPKMFHAITGYYHGMWRDSRTLFAVSLFFFMIIFLTPDDDPLIANRIGDFLGKISYSLYLLHFPVLYQIKHLAIKSPELFLPVFLCLSILISYISYLVIENPSRLLIKTIASRNRMQADNNKRRSFFLGLFHQ